MIKDLMAIDQIMINTLLNAHEEGDLTPDMGYPFSLSQVIGVHTHMKGVGDGVWFRLEDGTVWDAYGERVMSAKDSDFDTVGN